MKYIVVKKTDVSRPAYLTQLGCAWTREQATEFKSRTEALKRLASCGVVWTENAVLVRIKPREKCKECGRPKKVAQ